MEIEFVASHRSGPWLEVLLVEDNTHSFLEQSSITEEVVIQNLKGLVPWKQHLAFRGESQSLEHEFVEHIVKFLMLKPNCKNEENVLDETLLFGMATHCPTEQGR
jgi:hypothetical protein